jgi:hypothetical protein
MLRFRWREVRWILAYSGLRTCLIVLGRRRLFSLLLMCLLQGTETGGYSKFSFISFS